MKDFPTLLNEWTDTLIEINKRATGAEREIIAAAIEVVAESIKPSVNKGDWVIPKYLRRLLNAVNALAPEPAIVDDAPEPAITIAARAAAEEIATEISCTTPLTVGTPLTERFEAIISRHCATTPEGSTK